MPIPLCAPRNSPELIDHARHSDVRLRAETAPQLAAFAVATRHGKSTSSRPSGEERRCDGVHYHKHHIGPNPPRRCRPSTFISWRSMDDQPDTRESVTSDRIRGKGIRGRHSSRDCGRNRLRGFNPCWSNRGEGGPSRGGLVDTCVVGAMESATTRTSSPSLGNTRTPR
jgi:hypothetical protein